MGKGDMAAPTPTERVTDALFYGFLALLAWLTFLVFEPFLIPLVWASVAVILFYPWHRRLERRLGAKTAATISTLIVTAILIVPAILAMAEFIHQAIQALGSIELVRFLGQLNWLNRAWLWVAERVPGGTTVNLSTLAREGAQRVTTALASELGGLLRNIVIFVFDLVITIIAMFYFFRDAGAIMRWLRRSLPFAEEQRELMITQAHAMVFVTVASNLAAAALTGAIGGIAFLIVGIDRVVFWGVIMAFFALLPVVGAWMVWIPAAAWLATNGHLGAAIALLSICGVAVLLIDNVLRPLMISGRAEMNGLFVRVGVLGGIAVFGMIGLVLGPVIVAVAAGLLQAYTRPLTIPGAPESPSSTVLE
jgi:predicted PurR-regulated permease PerM